MSDDPPQGARRLVRIGRSLRFFTWAVCSWGTGLALGAALLLLPVAQAQAAEGAAPRRGGFVFWRKPAPEADAVVEQTVAAETPVTEFAPADAPPADTVEIASEEAPAPSPGSLHGLRAQNAQLTAQVAALEQALAQAQEELRTLKAKLEAVLAVPQAEDTELTRLYRVQEGDTLYTIAQQEAIYADGRLWRRIYEANRNALEDPEKLRPGQELIIPR